MRDRSIVLVLIGAVALAVVVFVSVGRGGSRTASHATSSRHITDMGTRAVSGAGPASTLAVAAALANGATGIVPQKQVPVDVQVTADRDTAGRIRLSVHLGAQAGSQVFGAEARLCPHDARVDFDADFRPTMSGGCALHALADGADTYVEVAGTPPYEAVDLTFLAGAGTDSYQRQDGSPVSMTCDGRHACDLVLKVQVPNSFGFERVAVTY